MKTKNHGLDEREMELVKLLMADCKSTGDVQAKLKKLFAGTIEQMQANIKKHYDVSCEVSGTVVVSVNECNAVLAKNRVAEILSIISDAQIKSTAYTGELNDVKFKFISVTNRI